MNGPLMSYFANYEFKFYLSILKITQLILYVHTVYLKQTNSIIRIVSAGFFEIFNGFWVIDKLRYPLIWIEGADAPNVREPFYLGL